MADYGETSDPIGRPICWAFVKEALVVWQQDTGANLAVIPLAALKEAVERVALKPTNPR